MGIDGCPHGPNDRTLCAMCHTEVQAANTLLDRVRDLQRESADKQVAAILDDFDAAFTVWVEHARRDLRGIVETVLRTRLIGPQR